MAGPTAHSSNPILITLTLTLILTGPVPSRLTAPYATCQAELEQAKKEAALTERGLRDQVEGAKGDTQNPSPSPKPNPNPNLTLTLTGRGRQGRHAECAPCPSQVGASIPSSLGLSQGDGALCVLN